MSRRTSKIIASIAKPTVNVAMTSMISRRLDLIPRCSFGGRSELRLSALSGNPKYDYLDGVLALVGLVPWLQESV